MVGSPVPRLGSACTKLSSIDINNSSHVSRQQILACAASAGQEASVAASDSGAPITTDPFAVIESEIQAQAQQEPDSFDKLGVSPLLQVRCLLEPAILFGWFGLLSGTCWPSQRKVDNYQLPNLTNIP